MIAHVNGTDLFYEQLGQGAPALMLLHGGLGLDHTGFRPYLDPLAEERRLVYYDHRGNGRSGRPPSETLTHAQLADDAETLRRQLGLGRIALLGHSYGGFVALEYALRHPDSLAGLILLCTAPAIDYPEIILANAQRLGTPEIMAALDALFGNRIETDEDWRRTWLTILPLYFHHYDPAIGRATERDTVFSGSALHRSFAELIPVYNVAARLGEIAAPTLVLSGRHDWITPPEQGERLAAGIPAAELVIFEHSGHYPFIEEPAAFLDTVRGWLRQLQH